MEDNCQYYKVDAAEYQRLLNEFPEAAENIAAILEPEPILGSLVWVSNDAIQALEQGLEERGLKLSREQLAEVIKKAEDPSLYESWVTENVYSRVNDYLDEVAREIIDSLDTSDG